jgi:aryl-alcohol dehydrogenase-like predicted oxidoreductase
MEKRRLGRSDLLVSTLCLGGNVFGWSTDETASFQVLDAYVAAGGNFIDTADVYSSWAPGNQGGESEAIIGRWMKSRGNRNAVVVTTKVGSEMAPGQKGLSRRYVREAVEASLRRLQTEFIDLYLAHWEDPETALDETLGVFADLVREGKVRAIGNSNFSAASMGRALAICESQGWPRFENLQTHYNLYNRAGYEAELEAFCTRHEIGVTSYFSLARGFLTGKYRAREDFAKSAARGASMAAYLNNRGRRILAALDTVASELRASPAQVAIAWLIARPGLTSAVASATSVGQLSDLTAATALRLTPEAIGTLDAASAA